MTDRAYLSKRHRAHAMLLASAWAVFARAQLVCEAPAFDFGVRPETALGASHIFTVRNVGRELADVVAVRSSCDCLTASLAHCAVPSGGTIPVDAAISFKNESGPQVRAVHLAYRLASDAPDDAPRICTLRITGTILRPVMREPDRLDLGPIPPGGISTGLVRLVAGRCGPFTLNAVATQSRDVRAEFTPAHSDTNHTVRLLIPAPPQLGAFSGLALAATDQPEAPTVPIAYAGRVEPWIVVHPKTLRARQGQPLSATLSLSSPFGSPFRLLSAASTAPAIGVSRSGDCRVDVRAAKLSAECRDALIRITTDHPLCPTIEVPVRVVAKAATTAPRGRTP